MLIQLSSKTNTSALETFKADDMFSVDELINRARISGALSEDRLLLLAVLLKGILLTDAEIGVFIRNIRKNTADGKVFYSADPNTRDGSVPCFKYISSKRGARFCNRKTLTFELLGILRDSENLDNFSYYAINAMLNGYKRDVAMPCDPDVLDDVSDYSQLKSFVVYSAESLLQRRQLQFLSMLPASLEQQVKRLCGLDLSSLEPEARHAALNKLVQRKRVILNQLKSDEGITDLVYYSIVALLTGAFDRGDTLVLQVPERVGDAFEGFDVLQM